MRPMRSRTRTAGSASSDAPDGAFSRPTALTHPRAVALLTSRDTFRVTDLERMATCSSAWFVERYLRPGEIDQVIGPKMKGSIAHVALQRFYSQLPSAIPGAERVTPENVEAAVRLMHECVDGALDSGLRIDVGDLERRELGQGLRRDLEQLVRVDAAASSTFVPRKLEVSFKSYELAPGVAVSGKIDRVDADPLSARGIIIDYKSGAAPSATQIHDEARLQIPALPPRRCAINSVSSQWAGSTFRWAAAAARGGCFEAVTIRFPASLPLTISRAPTSTPRSTTPVIPPSLSRSGFASATSSTTRRVASARAGARSGACAARSARERRREAAHNSERAAAGRDRGARRDVRLRGCGDGEDDRPRRAFRPRRRRGRPRRRLAARDHVYRSRRRRAAWPDQGAPDRARPSRPRPRPRRCLDLHDPRLLPAAAHGVSARGGNRPPIPRPRRGAGTRDPG